MRSIAGAILVASGALLLSAHSISYELNRIAAKTVFTHGGLELLAYLVGLAGIGVLISGLVKSGERA